MSKKYGIEIIYDTGDSFNNEYDVHQTIDLTFNDFDKTKQALKDIEEHYHYYMLCKKEWNAGKKDIEDAQNKYRNKPWIYKTNEKHTKPYDYEFYSLMLENDDGVRIEESTFWCGYFESLTGAEIVALKDNGMSFRI